MPTFCAKPCRHMLCLVACHWIFGELIVRLAPAEYDPGMTTSKIAITLPKEQLARVQREVRAGRADSVSGYIARALAEEERRESLRELVHDLIAQHGEPKQEDVKWAKGVLARRRRE